MIPLNIGDLDRIKWLHDFQDKENKNEKKWYGISHNQHILRLSK